MSQEYFFEMLTEEIPARMLRSRLQLLEQALRAFYEQHVGTPSRAETIEVDATSRRIYFVIRDLPQTQHERTEEVKGPPRRIAYDSEGRPTPALLGFLKKNGLSAKDLPESSDEYIRVTRIMAGARTADVLGPAVTAIIQAMRWPKVMRWGAGAHAFIRPVHSIISIFDRRVIPLELFGASAGNTTAGHRTFSKGKVSVDSLDDYLEKMEKAHVVVGADERVRIMRERCVSLAAQLRGLPAEDEAIWEQWRYLTEFPGVIRAEFNPDFLSLPDEVLITVMRVHQKQLPIYVNGKLSSSFLAVVDQVSDSEGNAAGGNAFVTNARFADARFFYQTDRKRSLEDRVKDLSHLQFQEKLGSYLQKTARIGALSAGILAAARIGNPEDMERAARLCKSDLGTEMVKEFTDLQGIVGGIYSREEGLPESVWMAIYDHYLPVNLDDGLPRNVLGAILSVADRMDTLTGFFALGMKPSGSKDPFGLRRAAQGIVQILFNRAGWTLNLGIDRLIESAVAVYRSSRLSVVVPESRWKELPAELTEFIGERVRTLLESGIHQFAYDEISAAMEPGWQASLADLVDRTASVRAVRNEPQFLSLLDSARRIANITAGQPDLSIDKGAFEHPTEKRLNELMDVVEEQIGEMIEQKKYPDALRSFAALAEELERFFVDVMVMVDDERVKKNRIALLQRVGRAVFRIADVTKIVVNRSEYKAG